MRKECKASVFMSFDWVRLWLRHFESVASPRVVVLERNGEIEAIAPFVLVLRSSMGIKVKRLMFLGNSSGTAEAYDLGVMYTGEEREIVDGIMEALREIDWNLMQLLDIRDESFCNALCERVQTEWQMDPPVRTSCPFVSIPLSGDILALAQSRTRRKMRKVTSTLEGEGRLHSRVGRSPEEVVEAMKTYIRHHRERWESKGGSIFSNDKLGSFMLDIGRELSEKGIAEMYEVLIDGEVASQAFCIKDGDWMRAYRIGINTKFMDFSPGYLVAHVAMKDAQNRGFKVFDWGKGEEQFKYLVGAEDRYIFGIQAKRGSLAHMSKIASLPGIRAVVEKTGVRESALRDMYK
ncbi:MAG: GNAT family N-acetyltransferase [Methanomassiliicoccales archaeon]